MSQGDLLENLHVFTFTTGMLKPFPRAFQPQFTPSRSFHSSRKNLQALKYRKPSANSSLAKVNAFQKEETRNSVVQSWDEDVISQRHGEQHLNYFLRASLSPHASKTK